MKNIIILMLSLNCLIYAGVDIEVFESNKKIKNYTFKNNELVNGVKTNYSNSMNILEIENNIPKVKTIPYGIKLGVKSDISNKNKYFIEMNYIFSDKNYGDKDIHLNPFQKVLNVKLMDPKNKSFELNILNTNDITKIELGKYLINIKSNNL